jgi:hypothetical protein
MTQGGLEPATQWDTQWDLGKLGKDRNLSKQTFDLATALRGLSPAPSVIAHNPSLLLSYGNTNRSRSGDRIDLILPLLDSVICASTRRMQVARLQDIATNTIASQHSQHICPSPTSVLAVLQRALSRLVIGKSKSSARRKVPVGQDGFDRISTASVQRQLASSGR